MNAGGSVNKYNYFECRIKLNTDTPKTHQLHPKVNIPKRNFCTEAPKGNADSSAVGRSKNEQTNKQNTKQTNRNYINVQQLEDG